MLKRFTITTQDALTGCVIELRKLFGQSRYLRINAGDEKPRSLSQNSLAHAWYQQISADLGDDTPLGVKCECKLLYGVPLLRAEDEEFREGYDLVIKPLAYEQKLVAMRYWPVTSLMTVGQLSRYLELVKEGYGGRVDLQFPDEMVAA